MLSLFMSISGGVSWENVIAPLKEVSLVWVVVYLFYISVLDSFLSFLFWLKMSFLDSSCYFVLEVIELF